MRSYQALAILLFVAGLLTGITAWIRTAEPSTVPDFLQPVFIVLVYAFSTSAAAPAFTIIGNLFGYAVVYFKTSPQDRKNLHYENDKLYATWLTYQRDIMGITALITAAVYNTPYQVYAAWISGSLAYIFELGVSVMRKNAEATREQAAAIRATITQ